MPYWCAAQLENNRVALATHHLKLSGYRVYAPRLRTYRFSSGRKVEERPLVFPSYAFVWTATLRPRASPMESLRTSRGARPAA